MIDLRLFFLENGFSSEVCCVGHVDPRRVHVIRNLNFLPWLLALAARLGVALVFLMLLASQLFASSEEFRGRRDAWVEQFETFKELMSEKRYAEAHKVAKRVFEEAQQVSPYDSETMIASLGGIGLEYYKHGIYYEAEPLLEKALKDVEKLWGKQHELYTGLLETLGGVRGRLGRYDEAEVLLKEAHAIEEAAYGPDHPRVAMSLFNLGVVYDWRGQYKEAIELIEKSITITENALGRDEPNLVKPLRALLDLYNRLNQPTKARECQERLSHLRSERQR